MPDLRRFGCRVRLVRAWRGAAIGVCAGSLIAAVWSALDWYGVADATPLGMASCAVAGLLLGAVFGAIWRLPAEALRASVDRRAGLENRLTASAVDVAFAEEIGTDAQARLESVRTAKVYPIRFGRWHGGALAATALAASVFLLGSTPLALSAGAKAERKESVRQGRVVERIRKEQFETPEARREMSEAERRLAEEARRLQRDLEKGRLNREEAMQRENELNEKAKELSRQSAQKSTIALAKAETAMEKMDRAALEKAGMTQADPTLPPMSGAQREEARARNAAEQAEIARKMAEVDKRLAEVAKKLAQSGLGEKERKALEAEKQSLEKTRAELKQEADAAKAAGDALKLSAEAQATLEKMENHELMKEIRKLAAEMAKANAKASQSGRPSLTPEQRAEMKKKLEELLAKLKDDEAMREYLEALRDAMKAGMKEGEGLQRAAGFGLGLAGLLNLPGTPDVGMDGIFADTGHVNRLANPEEGKGKTTATSVSGVRGDKGDESYVEIKAPTMVGNRTSVPYRTVLPSYRKKAEQALQRHEIPKGQEKRVRAYFESLTKG